MGAEAKSVTAWLRPLPAFAARGRRARLRAARAGLHAVGGHGIIGGVAGGDAADPRGQAADVADELADARAARGRVCLGIEELAPLRADALVHHLDRVAVLRR